MPKQSPDDDNNLPQFAKNLRYWRKLKGWNQKELAEKIGVHLTHVSRLENGATLPALDISQEIAKLFSTTVEGLSKARPEPGSEVAEAALAAAKVNELRGRRLDLIKQCLVAFENGQSAKLTLGPLILPRPKDFDDFLNQGKDK